MLIQDVLKWWYTDGWRQRGERSKHQLEGLIDYFSIDLLLKTLFSPYRQISAGRVRGSFEVQVRAFFDRLVSRFIGGLVRSVIIVIGLGAIFAYLMFSLVVVVMWAIVPLIPLIGVLFSVLRWLPWNL